MIKKDITNRALIVIDLQNDFCPGGALAVPEGNTIVPVVNRIAPFFSRVIATRDWHPPGHVSFASNHPGKRPFEAIRHSSGDQMLWPDHCVQGTRGADFHPDFDLSPVDLIVHKGSAIDLDSYSAFLENDHETPTGLEHYLKGLGIRETYLCGLATDFCVFFSAMDAARLGFAVTVFGDAVRGVDVPAGSIDRAIQEMTKAGILLDTSEAIMARLEARHPV